MTFRDCPRLLASVGVMTLVVGAALAQQPVVQPTQGQSAEQLQRDMADCQGIAKQSSGYDPAQAATQVAAQRIPSAAGAHAAPQKQQRQVR